MKVKLKDLCAIARGGSPRPIQSYITDADDGINWIKIGDTQQGGRYIDSTAEKIRPEGIVRSRYVKAGSFLLSNSMSFGRPYILRIDGCIHDGWLVLEPDYRRVDQDYLYFVLSSRTVFDQFDRLAAGSTVRNLNIGLVEGVEIPLPPLEEQRRIVAILDETFEGLSRARANAEANLQSARELFESYSGAVFSGGEHGWRSFPLEALVDPDCTLSYGIVQPGDEVAGGMPIVRPTDLGSRIIGLDGLKRIDPARASGYARTELKGGDLLLCVRGTTGTVSMAAPELRSANVTRGIVPIRFRADLVDQRLGYFILRSLPVQTQIRAATYGAALMQINIRDVRQIAISVPPRSQQAELVDQLEQAENDFGQLENAYVRQIDDLDQLRQSLLQKAFSGELTVKEFA